jgi:hypothetical protein
MRRDNTSGVAGVSYHRLTDTWLARIGHPRKTLGYFKTFDQAVAARRAAEQETP